MTGVEFTAACPCGHPDATWRSELEELVDVASDSYLGEQRLEHDVRCPRCGGELLPLPQGD